MSEVPLKIEPDLDLAVVPSSARWHFRRSSQHRRTWRSSKVEVFKSGRSSKVEVFKSVGFLKRRTSCAVVVPSSSSSSSSVLLSSLELSDTQVYAP